MSKHVTLTRKFAVVNEPHLKAAYEQSFKLLAALLATEDKEEKPVSVVHNPSVQAAQA